jgi:hypothetical protein
VWAALSMEQFMKGHIPFNGYWNMFHTQFKARFETINEVVDAKKKLQVLWQALSAVPEYATHFKELIGHTMGLESIAMFGNFGLFAV